MTSSVWLKFSLEQGLTDTSSVVYFSTQGCPLDTMEQCQDFPKCGSPEQGALIERICQTIAADGYLCAPSAADSDWLIRIIVPFSLDRAEIAVVACQLIFDATPEKYQNYILSHVKLVNIHSLSPLDTQLCVSHHLRLFLIEHGYFPIKMDQYENAFVQGSLSDLEDEAPLIVFQFIWSSTHSYFEDKPSLFNLEGYIGMKTVLVRGGVARLVNTGSQNDSCLLEEPNVFLLPDLEECEIVEIHPPRFLPAKSLHKEGESEEEREKTYWNRVGHDIDANFSLFEYYKAVYGIKLLSQKIPIEAGSIDSRLSVPITQKAVQLVSIQTASSVKTVPSCCLLEKNIVQLRGDRHWVRLGKKLDIPGFSDSIQFKPDSNTSYVSQIVERNRRDEEASMLVQSVILENFMEILQGLPVILLDDSLPQTSYLEKKPHGSVAFSCETLSVEDLRQNTRSFNLGEVLSQFSAICPTNPTHLFGEMVQEEAFELEFCPKAAPSPMAPFTTQFLQYEAAEVRNTDAPLNELSKMFDSATSNLWGHPLPLFFKASSLLPADLSFLHSAKDAMKIKISLPVSRKRKRPASQVSGRLINFQDIAEKRRKSDQKTVFPVLQLSAVQKALGLSVTAIPESNYPTHSDIEDEYADNTLDEEMEADIVLPLPPQVHTIFSNIPRPVTAWNIHPEVSYGPDGSESCTSLNRNIFKTILSTTTSSSSVLRKGLADRLTRLDDSNLIKETNTPRNEELDEDRLVEIEKDVLGKAFLLFCTSHRHTTMEMMKKFAELHSSSGVNSTSIPSPQHISLKLVELWTRLSNLQKQKFIEVAQHERFW